MGGFALHNFSDGKFARARPKGCAKRLNKEKPRWEIIQSGFCIRLAKLENGEGGIRTLDTGNPPYDGLANRCLQPLGHLSIYPQPRFKRRGF